MDRTNIPYHECTFGFGSGCDYCNKFIALQNITKTPQCHARENGYALPLFQRGGHHLIGVCGACVNKY